ncbi:Sucrase/ferredoxin-like-domain-containing protein [Sporodiniella umbellata]|nr:Sucrase/ferredoxin-like-domain-containing protein [Sporodiniella umbellata]
MEWISQYWKQLHSPCQANVEQLPEFEIRTLSPMVSADCQGCEKPCAHPRVPEHLKIDQSQSLKNTVPTYAMHLILLTGHSHWPAQIEQDGVARALLEKIRQEKQTSRSIGYRPYDEKETQSDRVMVSCCSLPSLHSTQRKSIDILLLPDNLLFSNITPRRVDALLDYIYGRPCTYSFSVYPCPWPTLFLVCGHGAKDKRCGTIGPMLQAELLQVVESDTKVALVSHLGGHAFAGNLVVYTHSGQRAIWYGRVTPCYCPEIVQYSLNDKVIQELVRGIFQVQAKNDSTRLDW